MSTETLRGDAATANGVVGLLRRHWPWLVAIAVMLLVPWIFFDWTRGRHSVIVRRSPRETGLMASAAS